MRLNEDFESTHDLAAWARICYGSAQEWSKRLDAACEFAYRFFFQAGTNCHACATTTCLKKKAISQLTSGIMLSWPQINAVQNSRVGHWGL